VIKEPTEMRPRSSGKVRRLDESINRLMAAEWPLPQKQTDDKRATLAQNEQVYGHAARTSDEADRDVVMACHARQVQ